MAVVGGTASGAVAGICGTEAFRTGTRLPIAAAPYGQPRRARSLAGGDGPADPRHGPGADVADRAAAAGPEQLAVVQDVRAREGVILMDTAQEPAAAARPAAEELSAAGN